jgi:ABC-2 type transport system permease protein
MTRLVRAELRRIAARRLVRVTVLLVAIAIVVGGILAFTTTSSLPEATFERRVRVADARQNAQDAQIRACLHAHGVSDGDRSQITNQIADACFPKTELTGAHDPRFHRARLGDLLKGIAGVLGIIGWAVGASLVGAEFASRSMTTMLTWETRRVRVIVAKAAVVIVTVAVFAALALIAVALALVPAMVFHGAPLRADDPSVATLAGVVARGATLAALASGMGFAIAALGRNTAAALGAGFAYIIVLENILGNSLRGWRRWLLLGNAIVFVAGRKGVDVPGRSVLGAGLFLGAVTATLLVAAAGAFKTRDVA